MKKVCEQCNKHFETDNCRTRFCKKCITKRKAESNKRKVENRRKRIQAERAERAEVKAAKSEAKPKLQPLVKVTCKELRIKKEIQSKYIYI